jgi:hypothetical protein
MKFRTADKECPYCNKPLVIKLPDKLCCESCLYDKLYHTDEGVLPFLRPLVKNYAFRLKKALGPWEAGRLISCHGGTVMGVSIEYEDTNDVRVYHFTDEEYFEPILIVLNRTMESN